MMLLALLFSNVVPAAESNGSKKRERLWCVILCDWEVDPIEPPPRSLGSDKTKPKPASKTTTEKR